MIASDYAGSPNDYVDEVVRRSAAPVTLSRAAPIPPLLRAAYAHSHAAPTRAHSQMAKVNTTLYGWSWGEFEFSWTTVGLGHSRLES